MSSIATEIGVDYYILECQGPGLPLSGKNHLVFFLFDTENTIVSLIGKVFIMRKLIDWLEYYLIPDRIKQKLFKN